MSRRLGFGLFLIAAVVLPVFANDSRPFIGNDICDQSSLTLENGLQLANGSCSKTVQGEIPNSDHMVSTIIFSPRNGDCLDSNKPFDVNSRTINLHTGEFDDPAKQYYKFPQELDDNGLIFGHSHITIQKLESDDQPPDPKVFAFFLGLNNPAKDDVLTANVKKGLPEGSFRICTMVASFGHQPTLMPVAQRGSQDDCIRIAVGNCNTKRSRRSHKRSMGL